MRHLYQAHLSFVSMNMNTPPAKVLNVIFDFSADALFQSSALSAVMTSRVSGCFRYQTLHGFISLSQVALSKVASSFLLFLLKKDGQFCENLLVVEIDGNCSYLPLMSFLLPDVSMLFLPSGI